MAFQRLEFAKLRGSPKVATLFEGSSYRRGSPAGREVHKSRETNSGLFGVREAGGVGETSAAAQPPHHSPAPPRD